MVRYPAVTTPVISHAEHGINEINVVIGHQLRGSFYTAVNGKREILSSISITKGFQIAEEYTHLDIQRSSEVPRRFLTSDFRGVLEYLCFPLPVVSIQPKLIGVAAVPVGRIGNVYDLIDFSQLTTH